MICNLQVRRPDDYDAKQVTTLGPSEASKSLNTLVLSQLKRPPPPPPAPTPPPAPVPALAAPAAAEEAQTAAAPAEPPATKALRLQHMVSLAIAISIIPE